MTSSKGPGRPIEMISGGRGAPFQIYIDPIILAEFDKVRLREHRSRSEILSESIKEYVNVHKEGNDSLKITNWVNDPGLLAVPNTMSRKEDWTTYINKGDPTVLRKLGDRVDFIKSQINRKLSVVDSAKELEERKLAKQKRSERLRQSCDIRNKDPSKMKPWEYERYKTIMKLQEENHRLKAESENQLQQQAINNDTGKHGGALAWL